MLFIVNLKILLESRYWSWLIIVVVLGSIGSYVAFTLVYDAILMDNLFSNTFDVYYTYNHMFEEAGMINFVVTVFSIILALLPDFIILVFKDNLERLQYSRKTAPMPA